MPRVHPWLGAWIPLLVLTHVLAAFLFVLLHGPSVLAMWRLRRERATARAAALLDMSGVASGASWAAVAFLVVSGAALASTEHVWAQAWVWASAVLLVVVSLSMSLLAARPFNEARHALGLRWFDGARRQPETGLVDEAAFARALAMIRVRAPAVMGIGIAGLTALVWLMVRRPL